MRVYIWISFWIGEPFVEIGISLLYIHVRFMCGNERQQEERTNEWKKNSTSTWILALIVVWWFLYRTNLITSHLCDECLMSGAIWCVRRQICMKLREIWPTWKLYAFEKENESDFFLNFFFRLRKIFMWMDTVSMNFYCVIFVFLDFSLLDFL